jgi:hypothetical protein
VRPKVTYTDGGESDEGKVDVLDVTVWFRSGRSNVRHGLVHEGRATHVAYHDDSHQEKRVALLGSFFSLTCQAAPNKRLLVQPSAHVDPHVSNKT